jgi:hypothetical protein
MGLAAGNMVGVGQHFVDDVQNMGIIQPVKISPAYPVGADQLVLAQLG